MEKHTNIVIDTVEAHTCHSDTWHVEIAPSEDYDGYRAKYCDICGDTIAVETLSAYSEHIFGDWITEQEATAVSMGIRYHECQNCFAKVVEYLPAEAGDFTCTVLNGTYCQITGYTGTETEISIPSEIDGYIVLHIAERAFQDNTALTTVVFPETIETMEPMCSPVVQASAQ